MKAKARLTHTKLDHTKENEIHLVVSLEAPKIEWEKNRQPICVIPVIDVSGSMSGDKLDYAKKSVMKLIDHLAPGDFCGIAAFASGVYPVAEPREMTQAQKDALKEKVGSLHAMDMTNFAGGMRQSIEWANTMDLSDKYVLRVIMFTDGIANVGECWGRDLIRLLKAIRGKTTLSAFGYGSDCDQELLADLAKEGEGNYTFVQNPDDALSAFAKELGGLLSRYAQDITIEVEPNNGHQIIEVCSDVDVEEDGKNGKKVTAKLPEILSEEIRHVVYELKTSEQSKALPREMNIASVKVSWVRYENGEKTEGEEILKAKAQFVKPGEEQKDPDPDVMKIVGLAKVVQAQIEAEEYATSGNFAAAQGVMASNAAYLYSCGLNHIGDHAGRIKGMMGDRHRYKASKGVLRGYAVGTSRGYGASAAVSADLAELGVSCSNTAQEDMENSFTSDKDEAEVQGNSSIYIPSVTVTPAPAISTTTSSKPRKKMPKKVGKKRSKRW